MNDALGDRMKEFEDSFCAHKFMPLIPVIARIDGRSFSRFTRGMKRPFDPVMSQCMIETTVALVTETNACVGYTQSDEISLAWYSSDHKSEIWFGGRITKMTSQLAAIATLYFYRLIAERIPDYASRLPTFDARVWQVPTLSEASNVFLWREWDATKNSITMAASEHFSHKHLFGLNGSQKQEMLFQKGVNWNDFPTHFKRGTYVQRKTVTRAFTAPEIESLPPKHEARKNPDLQIERSQVAVIELPPLASLANRNGVLFNGDEPVKLL